MKLSRNALADLEIFVHEGMYIEWKYIVKLNDIQMDEGFRFANKLSNRHIQFQSHKMNVSVAAHTFNSSIADALEFLMESAHPFFAYASTTIRFIRILNELLVLLNSKNLYGRGFKKPLSIKNQEIWLSKIDAGIQYLGDLRDVNGVARDVNGVPLLARDVNGVSLLARDVNGVPLLARDVNGVPLLARDVNGVPLLARDVNGYPY